METPRSTAGPVRKFLRGLVLTMEIIPVAWLIFTSLLLFYWAYAPAITVAPISPLAANAYDDFMAAKGLCMNSNEVSEAISSKNLSHPRYSLAEKEAMLRRNAPALARLRKGLARNYVNPVTPAMEDPHSHGACRMLARLLLLEAQVEASHGADSRSFSSRIDAVALGVKISNDGIDSLIGGTICASIGMHGASADIRNLNGPQARDAARRLERLLAAFPSDQKILADEKQRTLREMQEEIRSDCAQRRSSAFYARALEHASMTGYSIYMDRLVAKSSRPYSPLAQDPAFPKWPVYLMARIYAPSWQADRFRICQSRAKSVLFLTELALQAYRKEQGRYPENLELLVPGYLSSIPSDPFSNHMPLRYQRRGDRYVLYSIGPDTKDDGGRPIVMMRNYYGAPTNSEQRYFVLPESSGDIVAGVNQ